MIALNRSGRDLKQKYDAVRGWLSQTRRVSNDLLLSPMHPARRMYDSWERSVMGMCSGVRRDGSHVMCGGVDDRWVSSLEMTGSCCLFPLTLAFVDVEGGRQAPWPRFLFFTWKFNDSCSRRFSMPLSRVPYGASRRAQSLLEGPCQHDRNDIHKPADPIEHNYVSRCTPLNLEE